MSYLRALVRKTQSPRPAIAPRLAGPAVPPALGLEELVEEEIVTSARHPSPTLPPSAETPAAAVLPQRAPIAAARDESRRKPDEPASTPATDLIRPSAHLPLESPSPLQRTVSRSSRLIGRRMTAPPVADVEILGPGEAPLPADRDERPLIARRKPPAAAEPPPYPRVSPPAPAQVAMRERDSERPDVQISIGRLEVRAHIAASAKTERAPPFRPHLTLQDYLARRSGGQ